MSGTQEGSATLHEASALRSSVALLAAGRITTLGATFLTVAVMTRFLGVDGYGVYRVVIAILALAMQFANLGTQMILQRELAKPKADQSRVLGDALGLRIVSIGVAVLIAIVVAAVSLQPIVAIGVAVGAIGHIAMGAHTVMFALFQERLRQAGAVIAETVGAVALLGLATLAGRAELGVLGFVVMTALASALTAGISALWARRLLRFRPRFDVVGWRALLLPALPLAISDALTLIYYRFDTILLGFLAPVEAVGLYGVPNKLLDSLVGFALLFTGLLMPLMSRYVDTDHARFRLYLDTGVDTMLILSSAVLVGVLLYAEPILTLVAGAPFASGGAALRLLAVVFVVVSTRVMVQQAVTAMNAQRLLVRSYAVAAVVGLLTYVTLIPRLGPTGAAAGLLVGETIVAGWSLAVLGRRGVRLGLRVPITVALSVVGVWAVFRLSPVARVAWPVGLVLAPLCHIGLLGLAGGLPKHVLAMLRARNAR